IASVLAEQRGEFVCATAGHHMESMLAAFGSGAARVSHDSGKRILNVDIGGGTTKLALVERGKVIATAAVHVGGRLLVTDEGRRIVRLDPAGRRLAAQAGFHWSRGDVVDAAAMDRVAEWVGECIRATALVASEYGVQLSGNTIYISNPGALLPRKNLQVLQPSYVCEEHIDPKKLADAIGEHFEAFDLIEGESEAALALRWEGI